MEMKKFYIAPEVEILCFRPVETLATFWSESWNWPGSGGLGGENNKNPGLENDGASANDEEGAEDAD